MKNYLFLIVLAWAIPNTGCDEPGKQPVALTALLKCWTHSYEEETQSDRLIFRPCDYKEFGPSHYRQRILLKADDQASYLQLSPVDAHYMVDGTWHYEDQTKTLQIFDSTGMIVRNYIVELIAEDQLVLRLNPG